MIVKRSQRYFLSVVALIATVVPPVVPEQSKSVKLVAPKREQAEAAVRGAYEKFRDDTRGKNADYIPYLAKVDSKLFGIAIVTTDNQVLTMGDVGYSFSIHISKVFTMALAMKELGADKVFDKIGCRTYWESLQL